MQYTRFSSMHFSHLIRKRKMFFVLAIAFLKLLYVQHFYIVLKINNINAPAPDDGMIRDFLLFILLAIRTTNFILISKLQK